jgi:hypothetical protein
MARCPENYAGCNPNRQNPCPLRASDCRLNPRRFPVPGYIEDRQSFRENCVHPLLSETTNIELRQILESIDEDVAN